MPHSDPTKRRKPLFSNSVHSTDHTTRKDTKVGTTSSESNKSMSTQTNFNSSTTVNSSRRPKNKVQVYRETQTQTSRTVISLDGPGSNMGNYSPDSLSPRFDNYREELLSPRSECQKVSFPHHGISNPRYNFGCHSDDFAHIRRDQESRTKPSEAQNQNDMCTNHGCLIAADDDAKMHQNPRLASTNKKLLSPRVLCTSERSLVCQKDKTITVCVSEAPYDFCGDVLESQPRGSGLSNVPTHKRRQSRHAVAPTLPQQSSPRRLQPHRTQYRKIVINYLDQCEGCHQCELCEKKQKELLSGNALTRTFLERNRCKLREQSPADRYAFANKLRSQSYVENFQLSPRLRGKTRIPVARTTMKNAEEKCSENLRHPSLASDLDVIAQMELKAKSHSFMSPTISSERKDKSIEIKCLENLISPTRRGRSVSPVQNLQGGDAGKVPYIDKSDITFDKTNGNNRKESRISVKSSCNDTASMTSTGSTENALFQAIAKLRDENWNTALRGLAEVVDICRVADPEVVFPHMTIINQRLLELIKSPRSHVCRTSCQAVGHLFEFIRDTRRPEFDELVDTLLCKCADANKFIRHDANLALDCMVTHVPTFHAVRALCAKAPAHKNALVRAAAARLLVCAIVIAGPPGVLHPQANDHTRRRIVLNMVAFMEDRYGDVRKYGERIYKMLNKEKTFGLYLNRYLERDIVNKLRHTFRT